MVDARQQSALAPFIGGGLRREAPAHRKAFRLKRRERHCNLSRGQAKRQRKRIRSDRAQSLKAAAHDLDKGLLPRPCPLVIRRRGAEHRRRFQLRPQRPKLTPSLRRGD